MLQEHTRGLQLCKRLLILDESETSLGTLVRNNCPGNPNTLLFLLRVLSWDHLAVLHSQFFFSDLYVESRRDPLFWPSNKRVRGCLRRRWCRPFLRVSADVCETRQVGFAQYGRRLVQWSLYTQKAGHRSYSHPTVLHSNRQQWRKLQNPLSSDLWVLVWTAERARTHQHPSKTSGLGT